MQGRSDQENASWDRERSATARLAALNGTSKQRAILTSTSEHRAIPQRPSRMPRLDIPPETPRAPRPQRQAVQPKRTHRLLIVLGTIVAVVAIFAFVIVFLLVSAINQGTGPATSASDFLSSLSNKNYQQAYKDLGPAITIRLNLQEFEQQAQSTDQRYGTVSNYSEINNSAVVNNNTESFTYTITRSKMTKPYNMIITLQQSSDDNTWKVVDYGTSLGPTQ